MSHTAALLRRFGLPLLLLCGLGVAYALDVHAYLSLAHIKIHRDELQAYAVDYPLQAATLFIAAYTVSVGFSLPVASLLTLLGGFVFGLVFGTLYVLIGATLGATFVFLAARSAFGETLRGRVADMKGRFSRGLRESPAGFLLFLRLVPLFPFFVVNILPALFPIRLTTFIWTTALGILPGTAVYVNIGRTLGDINSLSDLISGQTLLALSLLGLLALVPSLYNLYRTKDVTDEYRPL